MDHTSSITSAIFRVARLSGDSQTERERGKGDETGSNETTFHDFFLSLVRLVQTGALLILKTRYDAIVPLGAATRLANFLNGEWRLHIKIIISVTTRSSLWGRRPAWRL